MLGLNVPRNLLFSYFGKLIWHQTYSGTYLRQTGRPATYFGSYFRAADLPLTGLLQRGGGAPIPDTFVTYGAGARNP